MKQYVFYAMILALMSILALGAYAATVMIDPATQDSPAAGETISVDVKVVDAVGLYGYQLDLFFDNTALNFSSISEGEFLGSDGTYTVVFVYPYGQPLTAFESISDDAKAAVNSVGVLTILSSRTRTAGIPTSVENIDGTGNLATVTFEVLEAKDSALEIHKLLFNINDSGFQTDLDSQFISEELRQKFEENNTTLSDEADAIVVVEGVEWRIVDEETYAVRKAMDMLNIYLPNVMLAADSDSQRISFDVENGAVEEAATGIKGDVNGDGNVRSNDAILTLRIASGLMEPTAEQAWAADMNGDGNVRSNDAILILRQAAGLSAPGISTAANAGGQIKVTLAEAHGVAGESIIVPVIVDNTYGLAGGDISISYDQTVLRAVGVSSDPDVMLAGNVKGPGTVRIAFASFNGLNSETVAKIKFDVLADSISPLTFRTIDFYSSDALPLDSRGINKEFRSWAMPPEKSMLLQNFPNPFNPETWMPYQLKDASEVTIRIYNTAGEQVRAIDLGYKSAGLYVNQDRAAYWDGKNKFGTSVASGVYFYSIQAGDFVAVRKLTVLK